MGRRPGENSSEDKALALTGLDAATGQGALTEQVQASIPEHLRLLPDEGQAEYLERVAPAFIEWLVGEAMFLKNPMAMASLTKLLEKKMDAQVKLEQITNRSGRMKQIISGAPGDIRKAMGGSKLDKVMSGQMRASDLGDEA